MVIEMNKQERKIAPEKSKPVIALKNVVPIADSNVRVLKKGGKATNV
jgi:hypothetical protein